MIDIGRHHCNLSFVCILAGGNLKGNVLKHVRGLEAEVNLLKTLQHDNIVRYLGMELGEDGMISIFLEYVSGGSLASIIAKHGSLKEATIVLYVKQVWKV